MKVSLEEAIEIHAKVLRARHKHRAPRKARDHALHLRRNGDHDGHDVWLRVAEVAEMLGSGDSEGRAVDRLNGEPHK